LQIAFSTSKNELLIIELEAGVLDFDNYILPLTAQIKIIQSNAANQLLS
jgi:hypothetical protein